MEWTMNKTGALLAIGFFVMSVVQFFALYAYVRDYWDWHWLLATPISMFLAGMPIVGSICGCLGAIKVWGWEWWQAGLLFFWWPAFAALGIAMGLIGNLFVRTR